MAGNATAESWANQTGVRQAITLLPQMPRLDLRDLFRAAEVSVSPSIHDGTPNTLLEAMACGSFPVAGDLDSIREWIRPGENGLLADATDPASLAAAVTQALGDTELRQKAAERNKVVISERADRTSVRQQALRLYERTIRYVNEKRAS
jgi:glycosyltransferase involved in cell wall biosynthesis